MYSSKSYSGMDFTLSTALGRLSCCIPCTLQHACFLHKSRALSCRYLCCASSVDQRPILPYVRSVVEWTFNCSSYTRARNNRFCTRNCIVPVTLYPHFITAGCRKTNHLKQETNLNYISRFGAYRAVNALRHCCKKPII